MRIYRRDVEERISLQADVREWTRSGLLTDAQRRAIEPEFQTDVRRTNVVLRAVFAGFTAVIAAAAVGLVAVVIGLRSDHGMALLLALSAVAFWVGAEWVVRQGRVYRYGVEEALAMASVVAAALSVALWPSSPDSVEWRVGALRAAITLAVGFLAVFGRFGFVYAGAAAVASAAAIPFILERTAWVQRAESAAAMAAVFVVLRFAEKRQAVEYRARELGAIAAVAWALMYATLNVHLSLDAWRPDLPQWFTVSSYALVWIVPMAGLTIAVRSRTRPLIDVNIALALVTLATNKAYLGLTHQSWDPMVLGVLLIGAAIAIRRWLAQGEDGSRAGFTAQRLLQRDRELLEHLGTVSAALPAPSAPAGDSVGGFGGGRSGGGGATAGY